MPPTSIKPPKYAATLKGPWMPVGYTHDPANPTEECWKRYNDWRRTKTPPLNTYDGEAHAGIQAPVKVRQRSPGEGWRWACLHNALLGLAGEAGEILDTALLAKDYQAGRLAELYDGMIDEIGDGFFYATWVCDCLESWPWDMEKSLVVPVTNFGLAMKSQSHPWTGKSVLGDPVSLEMFFNAAVILSATACLAVDRLKKVYHHGKVQAPKGEWYSDVYSAMLSLASMSASLGSNVSTVLKGNIAKLDHRYPDGFRLGGGVR